MTGSTRRTLPMRLVIAAIGAALAVWAAMALAAPTVIGITSAIVNDVKVRPVATRTFVAAKVRQRMRLADRVRTGAKSRVQLVLLDKTKFSVGSNAALVINRFVYDPSGGEVSASVAKGAFRFMSGNVSQSRKSVRTPSATIGIRGTVFDGAVGEHAVAIAQRERAVPRDTQHDPLTATLVVLRGPGANRQGSLPVGVVDVTGANQTVTLDAPLLAAYVPFAGATPIGPFQISLNGLGALNDFILPPTNQQFTPLDQSLFEPRRPRTGPPSGVFNPGQGEPEFGDFGPGIPDLESFPREPIEDVPIDPPPRRQPSPQPTHSPNF